MVTKKENFVDVSGTDATVKPDDNFFRFVNGRWDDIIKITGDQSVVGSYSFMIILQKKVASKHPGQCCKS